VTPVDVFLLLVLAVGLGLLADEVRGWVLDRRRRARQVEFSRALDEAVEVAMGRHPSRLRGPEDDDEALRAIGERAKRIGGGRP
jgi:hypothetical protein